MDVEKLKSGQAEIERRIEEFAAQKREQLHVNEGNDSQYYPIMDGSWCPEKYASAKEKILFIGREPNEEDGGWRYGDQPPDNNYFFGSQNRVAKEILTGDTTPDSGKKLNSSSALYQTAYTNISNLPGGGSVGEHGSIRTLYKENAPILEKKLEVYDADIIITPDADLIWPSIEKAYGGIQSYETTYVDKDGNILPDSKGAVSTTWHCVAHNGKKFKVIWAYHPSSIRRNKITQDSWVKSIVVGAASNKPDSTPVPQNCSESDQRGLTHTPESKRNAVSGISKGIPEPSGNKPIKPIMIAIGILILIIVLILLLMKQCKSSETAAVPIETPISLEKMETAPVVAVQPPPIFQESDRAIFVKNVTDLLSDADPWLNDIAYKINQELEQSPNKTFAIIGYSAIFPGLPEPVQLSQDRASKIKEELIKRGIPAEKLETVAGGETSNFGVTREENRRIKIMETSIPLAEMTTAPVVGVQPPPIFQESDRAIFVKNVTDLLSDADSWLSDIAYKIKQELEQSPSKTFTVVGYTAIFPGLPDPVQLSQERAGKIKEELIKRGIPAEKLETVAGGETSNFGLTREENRRIKIMAK